VESVVFKSRFQGVFVIIKGWVWGILVARGVYYGVVFLLVLLDTVRARVPQRHATGPSRNNETVKSNHRNRRDNIIRANPCIVENVRSENVLFAFCFVKVRHACAVEIRWRDNDVVVCCRRRVIRMLVGKYGRRDY